LDAGGFSGKLALFPPAGNERAWLDMVVFLSVVWWANHGADGGGYIIQRMMAAKSEKDAMRGTFLFSVVHYAVRLWPWVLVAIVSLVLFPSIGDRQAYPHTLAAILPPGLKGLCVAIFLAAFMSTIDTHLNWGASYIVNDLYKRFMVKDAPARHYVAAARVTSVLLMVLAALSAYFIDRISSAWEFLWSMGAGLGPVLVLRWFWWRVNAWTEITALAGSFTIATVMQVVHYLGSFSPAFHEKALLVVVGSAVFWIPVTFLTGPEEEEVLDRFQKRVDPPGRWPRSNHRIWPLLSRWVAGVASVYALMFGAGVALLGVSVPAGIGMVAAGLVLGALVWR
ncbi:MAG: sodium:proline symporter, partial [Deltaproteobacteria bacterium]